MKELRHNEDDWLHGIRDRLADFETDAPDGLWDDIVRRLGMPDTAGSENSEDDGGDVRDAGTVTQRRIIPLWARRAVAAAAAVAVILTSGIMLLRDSGTADPLRKVLPATSATDVTATPIADATPPTEAAAPENAIRGISTSAVPAVSQDNRPAVTEPGSGTRAATDKDSDTAADNTADTRIRETAASDATGTKGHSETDTPTAPAGEERQRGTTLRERYADTYADAADRRKGNAPRHAAHGLRIGAYASGGAAAYAVHGRANGVSSSIMAANDTNWEGSPLLGMLLYNRGKDTETRTRHHQPIRAGISFTYMINDRFGLESGLTYAMLASDMHDGSDKHYYDARQRLHYLGIPLNIKYDIARWRRFAVYGSAGLLAEQCIAGNTHKEYVLDGNTYRTSSEAVPTKPFQLSANLSAGVRYDFTPAVGIYAEPGVSYYFDDGTTLETVYKQRPLNFNLNVGIRFTVGR